MFHECEYGGVKQKWLLVRSEQAAKRETHTLSKRMHKQANKQSKHVKALNNSAKKYLLAKLMHKSHWRNGKRNKYSVMLKGKLSKSPYLPEKGDLTK